MSSLTIRNVRRVFGTVEVLKDITFRLAPASRGDALSMLDGIQAGSDEEIRLRAAMMASVDEGVGMLFDALEQTGQLDNTIILFMGDNGFFFGEHGIGPDRRFGYEEGIRSPLTMRYPKLLKAGALRWLSI